MAVLVGGWLAAARAAPPVGADATLSPWFQSLRQPDTLEPCCNRADCRAVRYRISRDHYQAYIGDEFPRWANAPYAWVDVPNRSVLHRHDNPLGEAVACWSHGRVVCFVEASGS